LHTSQKQRNLAERYNRHLKFFRQLVVPPLCDAYGTHGTQVRKHHSLLRQTGASLIIRWWKLQQCTRCSGNSSREQCHKFWS